MPNQKLATEWLDFSVKNLETAILLYRADHYTDVIAIEIQQAVEKALKSIFAFHGKRIPRTHSLDILYHYADEVIGFQDVRLKDIIVINDYYESERYPGLKYFVPDKDEIDHSLEVATTIIRQIRQHIQLE